MRSVAWRTRLVTTACIAAFLAATHALFPNPQVRADRQYLFVITIGYGHLIGAAVFSRARMARWVPSGVGAWLFRAFVVVTVLDLFAAYAWLSNVSVLCFVPLLAVSLWHIVENDLALARAERPAIGALARSWDGQLAALAATALLLAIGQALMPQGALGPELGRWSLLRGNGPARIAAVAGGIALAVRSTGSRSPFGVAIAAAAAVLPADLEGHAFDFADFFSAVTLYHLIGFLVLLAHRAAALDAGAERRKLVARLVWVHAPAALACVALLLAPGPRFASLRYAAFSPAIYLFWSVLHVAQTLAARGLEPRVARAVRTAGA